MARKPAPQYAPVVTPPVTAADLTQEEIWADGALQVKSAAEFIGVSVTTLKKMVRHQEVPSKLVKGRRVVAKRSLALWLAGGNTN